MYRQNKIVGLVFLIFFAAILVTGSQFRDVAKIMPVFVGCTGVLCSLIFLGTVIYAEKKHLKISMAEKYPKKDTRELIEAFVFIALYCLLLKPLGFVLSSFLFFYIFSLRFGKKEKRRSYLLYAVIVTLIIYFAFTLTLRTQFPAGILNGIL